MISIQGIKTRLVEVTESDAADMVKLRNDPANNKFLFQQEIKEEDQRAWITRQANRNDCKNFKVTNNEGEFKGTVSIYNISAGSGEFGRYIVTNPINAIEAEYLLLKICFETLKLNSVYCQTNIENKAVWGQHTKLGFQEIEKKQVNVGTAGTIVVEAVVQEITSQEFRDFNYDKVIKLIKFF